MGAELTPEELKMIRDSMYKSEVAESVGEQASADTVGAEDTEMASKNFSQNAEAQYQQVSSAGAAQAAKGAGDMEKAGGLTMGAGAVSGNPVIGGVGLGLTAIGMIDSAKRQQEQAKIDAYNKKIMAQRSAIRNMFA